MKNQASLVDIPFSKRRHCWFCGEPFSTLFSFPHQNHLVLDCPHPRLVVPSCSECNRFALSIKADSIWDVSSLVKKCLMKTYQKDLAIGLNWTQEELAESQFEGGNFAGFQKSAWFMYEVAKDRVNYMGYPLSYNGIELEVERSKSSFNFDGINYPSVDDAISHYSQAYGLNKRFFTDLINKGGHARFSAAIRLCRIMVGATPNEQREALLDFN